MEKSIALGERDIASLSIKGSGGGSVGRGVPFFTRGPRFESHLQYNETIFYQLNWEKTTLKIKIAEWPSALKILNA